MLARDLLRSRLRVHPPPGPVVHVSTAPFVPNLPLTTTPGRGPWSPLCTRIVARARQRVELRVSELWSRSPTCTELGGGGGGGGAPSPAGPVERSSSKPPPRPSFGAPRNA